MTFSLLSRAVMLLAPLLIMPAMLDHLGSARFGVWVTGTSVVALAAFMDFGIGNSLLTRLSTYHGRAETETARRSIGAAYRILGLVSLAGLALLCLGWGLAQLWPGVSVAGVSGVGVGGGVGGDMAAGNGALVVVMLLLFLAGLPLTIVYRVLYANQQMLLYNMLQIASSACSVAFTFLAIRADLSGLAVVAVFGAVPVLFMLGTSVWFFAAFPDYRPRGRDFGHGDEGRDLFALGLGHLGLGILTAVGMNIDIPLILSTLGSDAVTAFALPSRIGSLLLVVVVTVFMPLWSFNGAAMARHDYAWVRRNTFRMSVAGGVAVAALGVGLTLGIDLIMQLWVGKAFDDQRLVLAAMTLSTTVIAVTSPYNMVLNAAGQVKVQIWGWGAFVVVSVIAKVLLLPILGAWSVAMVTAVVYAVCVTPAIILSALRVTRAAPGHPAAPPRNP